VLHGALDGVFFAAGGCDGGAVGDGGADEVLGCDVDVEFWGLLVTVFHGRGLKETRTVVAKGVRCASGRDMVGISQGLGNVGYALEEGWYHRGDEGITAAILWEDRP
jgi:hypothetical protein